MCAYAFKSMFHCGSAFEPGTSGLPYYCAPPVCVPAVIGALAVWRQNNNKKKSNHRAASADQGSFLWSLWCSQGNDSDKFRRRCQCAFQETWEGNGEGNHEGSGQSYWNRNRTWNVTMKKNCCYVFENR